LYVSSILVSALEQVLPLRKQRLASRRWGQIG
jgi:hypothetical protein